MGSQSVILKEVSHRYERQGLEPFQSLHDVSFALAEGEFVAILGRSGSGKTTLLNLLAGLDRPSSGQIEVAGQGLAGMDEDALARWRGESVGVIFQFFQLLPALTVRENLLLPMEFVGTLERSEREARVLELLAQVGIADQADKLPSALSGGQQQRVAIARALVNGPTLLIADEPTGNLDSESAEAVLSLFRKCSTEGVTLVVVTHDPKVAAQADRVLELSDGRLISPETSRLSGVDA